MAPRLSIIIPTYQEEYYIENTLRQFAPLDIPHELILTDGGSTDDTLKIARQYTDKVVVWDRPKMNRRQSFGEAKNTGAKLATGEFLVFINTNITIPDPNHFFDEMLALFERKPNLVGATVPFKPLPGRHALVDTIFQAPWSWGQVFMNNVLHLGAASGEFQMIRRAAFEKLHGYREDIAAVEDGDMFMRLSKLGRTYSNTRVFIQHSYRRIRTKGWPAMYYTWLLNGLHYALYNQPHAKEWEVIR
jgi:glycosyltransferase involved in cell wall biosynthesis